MADKTIFFFHPSIMVFLLSKISPSKVIIVVIPKSGGRLRDVEVRAYEPTRILGPVKTDPPPKKASHVFFLFPFKKHLYY